uniref:Uncharacterized protein n=1 Tax=Astatotilapia calliptera TaxID=8154 RepID=A0A3P8PYM3_ASTCA
QNVEITAVSRQAAMVATVYHLIGAVVTAPALLGAAGFNSAGIAAGSCAAGMMSSAAASNGGEVTAGGVVAVLQSAVRTLSLTTKVQLFVLTNISGTSSSLFVGLLAVHSRSSEYKKQNKRFLTT